MICPNHPLVCEAYILFGSTGDPFRWYISQPAKCGPLTSHFSRLPSDVRMNAPFFVPTSTRTPLMRSLLLLEKSFATSLDLFVPDITIPCPPLSTIPSFAHRDLRKE